MNELGSFASTIFRRTYAFDENETWEGCAARVAKEIANGDSELETQFFEIISTRKFIPGGRYLAQSGRDIKQFNNCLLLRAEDSREGWGDLLNKHVLGLSTGGGVGTYYEDIRERGRPIGRFGGVASGSVSLMSMVNEVARHVMAGGKRRSALWAGLPWWHPDMAEFLRVKNWSTQIRAMKEQDFNFPAPLDMTNISVCLDDAFFRRIKKDKATQDLYYNICKSMCKGGEPGFSVNLGSAKDDVLRNPCLLDTTPILTINGIVPLKNIVPGAVIWSGKQWTKVLKKWKTGTKKVYKYHTSRGLFIGTDNHRVLENGIKVEVKNAKSIDPITGPTSMLSFLNPKNIIDGLVIGDGSVHSRKEKHSKVYLHIGEKDKSYLSSEISGLLIRHRPGLTQTAWEVDTSITPDELPVTYKRTIPDRYYYGSFSDMKGFLRGLFSANGSVINSHKKKRSRVALKQSSYELIKQVQIMLSALGIASYITINKEKEIEHRNGTYTSKISYNLNISTVDDISKYFSNIGFIQPYKVCKYKGTKPKKLSSKIERIDYIGTYDVYDLTVEADEHTFWTGGLLVSNCCEVTSSDSNDVCNLGSINLSRIENLTELEKVTRIAVRFLYNGTFLSWLPHEDFYNVRKKNRRIGLGLMGLHEWCINNNQRYEPSGKLGKWLHVWQETSDDEAKLYSNKKNDVRPIAVRAIAPTGTIGIIAETTTGIEPIFCVSYKRRFLDSDGKWKFKYVIDPTAEKLIQKGVDPTTIEDSISLAKNVEKRIAMQAYVQEFVDMAISSTINMPEWGEYGNSNVKKFSETLLKYLPKLRGITVYPDGSRPGQPIVSVDYELAKGKNDVTFEESDERCSGGVCGV